MSQIIKLKRGTTIPTTSDLVSGEVAVNTDAQKLYINDNGTVKEIGGGTSGIASLLEDSTPQLGGDLDLNSNDITGTGNIDIAGNITLQSILNFVSPNSANTISVEMLDTDTVSFSGDSGELFSVTDSMTGTIYSVNDISGIPSIEVDDDGTIRFAEITGNVLIGTNVDDGTNKVQVNGSVSATAVNLQNSSLTSTTSTLTTVTQTPVILFAAADYSSGKVLVQATDTVSGEVHISELLIAHDGTTAYVTEYGVVFTGSAELAEYAVDINSGNVRLLITSASANSTQYNITQTLVNA